MPDWIPWPILALTLGFMAVAAVVLVFDARRERRRIEELTTWAASQGFTIAAGLKGLAESGLSTVLIGLPIFRRGRTPRVRNLIRGMADGQPMLLFDFRYTVQSGKNSTSIEQTIVAFERGHQTFPSFELAPEGLLSRIAQAFGAPDIDFEHNPEFSSEYQLKGQDADAVRHLFERSAVSYLAHAPGWSIQGTGNWLIVFRHDRRVKPEDLSFHLEQVRQVARTLWV